MCGRFSLTASPQEVAEALGIEDAGEFPPRYNIAPTQPILVAVNGPAGGRVAVLVRWGLVPSWVKEPKEFTLLINARSETAAQKPAFRAAMRHRRVLVPASGFYEWKRPEDPKAKKQAYWIRPAGGGVVTFGGLMETWHSADGSEIDSGAILTTAANSSIGAIHDRMPVVIRLQDHDRWLDCKGQEPRDVAHLMQPVTDDFFEAIPVGDKVNKVANSGPDIQERIHAAAPLPAIATPAKKPGSSSPGSSGGGQLNLL
jgi:putative SOS response-associated peptidase YedK